MLIFLKTALAGCYQAHFDHEPVKSGDIGCWVDITEKGVLKYLNINIDMALFFMKTATFPDVEFEILNFMFKMTDMKVSDMTTPDIMLTLIEDGM